MRPSAWAIALKAARALPYVSGMGWSDYEITKTLSKGSVTAVYRAVRKHDGARLVIKTFVTEYPPAHLRARLEREAHRLRRVQSSNVVELIAYEPSESLPLLALADVDGVPLSGLGPFPISSFLSIALQLTRGLAALHASGIIHRDVKPDNAVLNQATGRAYLIDLSSASLEGEHELTTKSGTEPVSPPYMSPEQSGRMNRSVDYRTDFYSLGITFYELLSGSLPFEAEDAMGWVHCHLSRAVPDVRERMASVPQTLALIIAKLTEKDPDARYQGCAGLLADLERCRDGLERSGEVPHFEPGASDLSPVFRLPTQVFGRNAEIQDLVEQFEASRSSSARLLLVEGAVGVGKSAVLSALQPNVQLAGGFFARGSFDRLGQAIPYSGVLKALDQVMSTLLALSEQELDVQRSRILSRVGPNGRVLTELLPSSELVLGAQPALAELGPAEALRRLKAVLSGLLQALATAEHPLVLLLDDLQWADPGTLELLRDWFVEQQLECLLVAGGVRTDEDENQAVTKSLAQLRGEAPSAVTELKLGPLSRPALESLVGAAIGKDSPLRSPLGEMLEQKTAGNPYFAGSLLRELARQSILRFDSEAAHWTCDLAAASAIRVSDNVAGMMLDRLRSLPEAVLHLLQVAACFGIQTQMDALARVAKLECTDVETISAAAVKEDLVVLIRQEDRSILRFTDERVQQAAYDLSTPDRRAEIHLAIARYQNTQPTSHGLLERVNHYNRGCQHITDAAEFDTLVELNRKAGDQAMQSAAYPSALSYFQQASQALTDASDEVRKRNSFIVGLALAECLYQTTQLDAAARQCERLLEHAADELERAHVTVFQARLAEHAGDFQGTLDLLRAGLAQLKIELPADHDAIGQAIGGGIEKMQAHLAQTPLADIPKLPLMENQAMALAMRMLYHVVPSAIQTYPPLFILAELLMFDLTLREGLTPYACKNVMDCGIIQGSVLGDYRRAFDFGQSAFALIERFRPTAIESSAAFVQAAFIAHWSMPVEESLTTFDHAETIGRQTGDVQHTLYAQTHRLHRLLLIGRPLPQVQEELERLVPALEAAKSVNHVVGAQVVRATLERLQGSERDTEALAARRLGQWAELENCGNAQWLFAFAEMQLFNAVILQHWDEAHQWLEKLAPLAPAGSTLISVPEYAACETIALCANWDTMTPEAREQVQATVTANLAQLEDWASCCAANFEHKYLLAKAEWARCHKEPADVVASLYEGAAETAGENFTPLKAFALERHGRYWQARQQTRLARALLREAYQLYARWGARLKLEHLSEEYPGWFAETMVQSGPSATQRLARSTNATATAALDLAAVMKSTQAISGEVKLERLFARLMETIIENAGAECGYLMLLDADGHLQVEARADLHEASGCLASRSPEDYSMCLSVVRYVARSGETLVLDDAVSDPQHGCDPYFQASKVRSVLCLPIKSGGKLVGLVYAENNATSHAFVPEKLAALSMIASQAAISITNARLYDHLEEKVAERTVALRKKTDDVVKLLENIQQGVFTVLNDGTIHPEYSHHLEEILETNAIAGKTLREVLLSNTNLAPAQLAAVDDMVTLAGGTPLFLFEVNQHCLPTEVQLELGDGRRKLVALEWIPLTDEDDIVTTVMITAKDTTELRALQAETARQRSQMLMVEELLRLSGSDFLQFAETCDLLMRRNRELIQQPGSREGVVAELFRNTHTIKGNAGVVGLRRLVDAAHELEELYCKLQNGDTSWEQEDALAAEDRVQTSLQDYREAYYTHLAGRERYADQSVPLAELRHVMDVASSPDALAAELKFLVNKASNNTLEALLAVPIQSTRRIAENLAKNPPVFKLEAADLHIPESIGPTLRSVFTHVLRNSIDHGLETPAERQAAGKSAIGVIVIEGHQRADMLEFRVTDDGRGLALEKLRARFVKTHPNAVHPTVGEIADSVFGAGNSTAAQVTELSGRGVGLDAVRSFLRAAGGDARIELLNEEKNGFAPFCLVLTCAAEQSAIQAAQ